MRSDVSTRFAKPDDHQTISRLVDALAGALSEDGIPFKTTGSDASIDNFIAQDRGCAILAEDETGPLGLVTASFNLALRYGGEYAQVEELIVLEAARGKGVGATLITAVIDAARQRGCVEIGLYAVPRNQAFYEKMGFAFAGPDMRMTL
ncbi:MAG: GNAT family N-acetyltransferase [Pseudomonadota bacterium]